MDKKRITTLVLIMVAVSLAVGGVAIGSLYQAAFEEEREHLVDNVQIQARLMEAVARFDARYSQRDHPDGAVAATLSQIEDAYSRGTHFGKSGAFVIGQKEGGQIGMALT